MEAIEFLQGLSPALLLLAVLAMPVLLFYGFALLWAALTWNSRERRPREWLRWLLRE